MKLNNFERAVAMTAALATAAPTPVNAQAAPSAPAAPTDAMTAIQRLRLLRAQKEARDEEAAKKAALIAGINAQNTPSGAPSAPAPASVAAPVSAAVIYTLEAGQQATSTAAGQVFEAKPCEPKKYKPRPKPKPKPEPEPEPLPPPEPEPEPSETDLLPKQFMMRTRVRSIIRQENDGLGDIVVNGVHEGSGSIHYEVSMRQKAGRVKIPPFGRVGVEPTPSGEVEKADNMVTITLQYLRADDQHTDGWQDMTATTQELDPASVHGTKVDVIGEKLPEYTDLYHERPFNYRYEAVVNQNDVDDEEGALVVFTRTTPAVMSARDDRYPDVLDLPAKITFDAAGTPRYWAMMPNVVQTNVPTISKVEINGRMRDKYRDLVCAGALDLVFCDLEIGVGDEAQTLVWGGKVIPSEPAEAGKPHTEMRTLHLRLQE